MKPRAAEFFAGIGLVRLALQDIFDVVWANDIEPTKHALYAANFDDSEFVLDDIRNVAGGDIPDIELATASFPCVDLSLAGNRRGLAGEESGMFWEFARVLDEMGERQPRAVCLENVPSFGTSRGGDDLRDALARLNELGYICDLLILDAKRFVPQSRPRLFIIGELDEAMRRSSELRPLMVRRFFHRHGGLRLQARDMSLPLAAATRLHDVVERIPPLSELWWSPERVERFIRSLAPVHERRLEALRDGARPGWATAYRRTRRGRAVWEIRADEIAGCLRTARGGSSKQALVEGGDGEVRVRWLTPREYARLQGVPDAYSLATVTPNQALFGLGDAVCVPAVRWLAHEYLAPLVQSQIARLHAPARIA